MKGHFGQLDHAKQLIHLESVARRALAFWGLTETCGLSLLSLSENATYAVSPLDGPRLVMRVHRTDYHSHAAILSELEWMRALQTEADVKTPQAIAGLDGTYLANIGTPDLDEQRWVALFDWIEGSPPDEAQLKSPFRRLGEVTARLHKHARQWSLPGRFERLRWDFEGCLGTVKHWGDWRDAPGLDAGMVNKLQGAVHLLHQRLEVYGTGTDRFGLIHADLRLANLLEVDSETRVIDFDDAGFGWYLYDLASALSFIETRLDVPDLVNEWVKGYRQVAPLQDKDLAEIPSFILLRRMTLLAWIGSHPETELAQSQGASFSHDTLTLAGHYLDSSGARTWAA